MNGTPEPRVILLTTENHYQRLLSGAPETCGMRGGHLVLAPAAECGEHSTNSHEEVLVVLSGRGVARLGDGASLAIGGGQIVYIPPYTTHNIVNTGAEVLRYVYVVAPIVA